MAETYRSAGVDIAACDSWLDSLKSRLPAIGGFAGLFPLSKHIAGMSEPCLVAGTDGVGTKVLVAKALGDLSTIGIDCVAMVINDLICCGAQPLFFLDYLAMGKFDAKEADQILEGLRRGCEEARCDLIGGETAELPGLLPAGDFDVAGFGVGVVDRARLITGEAIAPGDVVIGVPSSGIHSNGLSLARHALPQWEKDEALARELLAPTRIYVREVAAATGAATIKGIAHITGGGLPGNLNRTLPKSVNAMLDPTEWDVSPIFKRIAETGIDTQEMHRAFNMGIGLCLVVASADAEAVLSALAPSNPSIIGEIVAGEGRVIIEGVNS